MPEQKRPVLVGMSGGVDSAVAAALLINAGYPVVGVTLRLWTGSPGGDEPTRGCCSIAGVQDARETCAHLGIEHYVVDVSDAFIREVVDPFVAAYARGRTPNPCTACNAFVRFTAMVNLADRIGCGHVATGHYARVRYSAELQRWELLTGVCAEKDQSYMLYGLTQELLSRVLLPLGEIASKEQTRALGREFGLHVADRSDSQDICFVGSGGYEAFLKHRSENLFRPGPIIDEQGREIGTHRGVGAFTVGQRRRLPPSNRGPLFVTHIDAETATVTVGPLELLYSDSLTAGRLNWVSISRPSAQLAVQARIRYNAHAARAAIAPIGDAVVCRFEQAQRAITPGQAVVFYDDERVLGGGIIEHVPAQEDNP